MDDSLFTVYAIVSQVDQRIYVGFTSNLQRRIKEHNAGKTKSTKGFRPWKLFWSEPAPDRISARAREKYLKSSAGKRFLRSLLKTSS